MGEGLCCRREKKQGVPKKTSGRSYSLEHPVARHFVWHCVEQAKCRPQAVQNKSWRVSLLCRNCLGRERITSGCRRKDGATVAVENSRPASVLDFGDRRFGWILSAASWASAAENAGFSWCVESGPRSQFHVAPPGDVNSGFRQINSSAIIVRVRPSNQIRALSSVG